MRVTATRVSCSLLASALAFASFAHGAQATPLSPAVPFASPPGTVVVRSGDTLSGIAVRLGVTTRALAEANGLANPNLVFAGQVLTVPASPAAPAPAAPAPARYTVRKGDTLASIARANGVTVADMVAANGIANPNLIVIGRTLTIPAPAAAPARSVAPARPTTGLPEKLVASPERLALRERFDLWASTYGVPSDLLQALAWMESGWQNHVVSSTGAIGIGQLMPATVDVAIRLIGVRLDPRQPDDNIRMSARFLRYLLDRTGDPATALAAYYQGLASVQRSGPYPGTVVYVNNVLALQPRFA